jgi:hypothetical protein
MLVALKVAFCVLIVEVGLRIANRAARGVAPVRELAPPRVTRPVPVAARAPAPPPERVVPGVPGVELEGVAVQPVGSQCRVCAHGIEERLVICSRCEAPHHAECWTYNEGCSTYACLGGMARASSGC